jgi:NADPH:quinone reductase
MRAATYERVGPAADVLEVREVDRPEPGPGQVLVRVVVSAINPTDVKIRGGATPRDTGLFQVPHMDGAGVVETVGPGVDPSRVGERVWLMLAAHGSRWGTAAQYTVVASERALVLPDDISFDLGATLGVPAVTAAHCLFHDGPVAGRDVLVAGGAGAVGRSAVELAHWAGARVAATVSGPAKAEIATAAGADLVVNYRDADAADQLARWTSRVERIVEVALGQNIDLDLSVSAPGTTIVTYATDGPDPVIPVRRCMTAGVSLRFMLLYTVPEPVLAEAVRTVTQALAGGALTMPPVLRFPLDQIAAAQEAQEAGPLGRVLVDIPG